jgi:hypothetical protein
MTFINTTTTTTAPSLVTLIHLIHLVAIVRVATIGALVAVEASAIDQAVAIHLFRCLLFFIGFGRLVR